MGKNPEPILTKEEEARKELNELLQRGAAKGKQWEHDMRAFSQRTEWTGHMARMVEWFTERYALAQEKGLGRGTLTDVTFDLGGGLIAVEPDMAFYTNVMNDIKNGPGCVHLNYYGTLEAKLRVIVKICLWRERNPEGDQRIPVVPEARKIVHDDIVIERRVSGRKRKGAKRDRSNEGGEASYTHEDLMKMSKRKRCEIELQRKYQENLRLKEELAKNGKGNGDKRRVGGDAERIREAKHPETNRKSESVSPSDKGGGSTDSGRAQSKAKTKSVRVVKR